MCWALIRNWTEDEHVLGNALYCSQAINKSITHTKPKPTAKAYPLAYTEKCQVAQTHQPYRSGRNVSGKVELFKVVLHDGVLDSTEHQANIFSVLGCMQKEEEQRRVEGAQTNWKKVSRADMSHKLVPENNARQHCEKKKRTKPFPQSP